MENELDWKEKARRSLVKHALEYIEPAQDVRDLELKAFYVVASFGRIKESNQEQLLDNLYNFKGSFKHLKHTTIKNVREFLQRYIK